MTPETKYAKSTDGVHIAYQVVGNGPYDLVLHSGWMSNVDAQWEMPDMRRFLGSLAEQSRLICFDRRGVGVSDRPADVDALSLEKGVDDTRTVLDAVGSERAVHFGFEDGAIVALLFAASYPERSAGLFLFSPVVKYQRTAEYPWAFGGEEAEEWTSRMRKGWGTDEFARYNLSYAAPSRARDPHWVRAFSRYMRLCASPAAAFAIDQMQAQLDVTSLLPAVRVPTILLKRTGDRCDHPIEAVRWVASRIPGSKMVELRGDEHAPFLGETGDVFRELDRFAASVRDEEADFGRVLATVLVTDIVGSTGRAASIGDRSWRDLVERHHATVRTLLARYRGQEMDTAGDGFLATFDGPARGVRCGQAIVDSVRSLGLEVRAGCHTGEVETIDGKIGGIAVHIGARVAAAAQPGEVLVTSTVKDLVAGSGLAFEERGAHRLKGVPDEWRLYAAITPP